MGVKRIGADAPSDRYSDKSLVLLKQFEPPLNGANRYLHSIGQKALIGHDGATQAIDGILSKRAGLVESVRVFGGSAAVSDSLLARVTSYLG